MVATTLVAPTTTELDYATGDTTTKKPAPATIAAPPPTTTAAPRSPVTVTGPIEGGGGMSTRSLFDVAAFGYTEEEYFIEGDATSYAAVGELKRDGKWVVEPATTMPFRTRIVVRRPAASEFSGTVFVEWFNVSGGADANPDWGYTSDELIREGHAWVGVSAQAVGVVGGDTIMGDSPAGAGGLVAADPIRYGTLSHPGDAYSFDIYTQAAEALTDPHGPSPLGDLRPEHVVAIGESQSAFFLTTYINAVHPTVGLFDGFLVHSRGGPAPGLEGSWDPHRSATTAVSIRDDVNVPVLVFLTETDLTVLGTGYVDQPDSDLVRVWEAAGTAHADAFLLEEVYGLVPGTDVAGIIDCPLPVNSGPQHEILQAAVHHFEKWVSDGEEPPVAPRLQLAVTDSLVIARDELGIALGGVRSPSVDVPVAVLSGDLVDGASSFCRLFGSTGPLNAEILVEMYPTSDAFLEAFDASLQEMIDAGFILQADVGRLTAAAEEFAATLGG